MSATQDDGSFCSFYVGRELAPQERIFIQALASNYPDGGITQVQAFHNADFSDSEDVPGGLLMVHPIGAQVHVDSIPMNAFSYLTVVLTEGEIDASKLNVEALHEACPQFSSRPPSLRCQSIDTDTDGASWNAEFGEDDTAFAGLFKQTKGRDTKYYIVSQAGAPQAVKQLREKLIRNPMNFGELLKSREYNYAHYIAKRNSERLAYNVGRALRLPMRAMADVGSAQDASRDYLANPPRAVPLHTQANSTIEPKGNGQVAIFHRLTPVSNCAPLQFVYEGPYNGIAVFAMPRGGAHGLALPAHSGKISSNVNTLSQKEIQERCRGIICEGLSDVSQHPEIASEAYNSTSSEEFTQAMEGLGWRPNKALINNLVPVLLKISNPELRRNEQ